MKAARFELTASIDDLVDGPNSGCQSTNAAFKLARSELDRIGPQSWKVVTGVRGDRPSRPCARVSLDPNHLRLVVVANDRDDPEVRRRSGDIAGSVFTLREALRKGFVDKCVNLTDAAALATSALGDEPHRPLTTIEDPTVSCTRVDMVVGGSVQVTLRGPATSTR